MAEKTYDLTTFWRIIVPFVILVLLIYFVYLLFTMPDWALGIPAQFTKALPTMPGTGA
jgi:hypothetical protein